MLSATKSFTPSDPIVLIEENVVCLNKPVPTNVAGVWVMLLGGGAAGVMGVSAGGGSAGGQGGGGGAKIDWVFVPVALLGPTYSVNVGVGGTDNGSVSGAGTGGGWGTDSLFSSGSVFLTAGGAQGITGGIATAVGVSAPCFNGGNGGAANSGAGTTVYTGAGAGGGGGGYAGAGPPGGTGGSGGAAATPAGAVGVYNGGAGSPPIGNAPNGFGGAGGSGGCGGWFTGGGAGGNGAKYGGGGGGAGGSSGGGAGYAGTGGNGYTLLKWVGLDQVTRKGLQATGMSFDARGNIIGSWEDVNCWAPLVFPNGYVSVLNESREFVSVPNTMMASLSGSITYSGAAGTGAKNDPGPYTAVGIFDDLGNLIASAAQYGGAGTLTPVYTGTVDAQRSYTVKIYESNVAGYGVYLNGSLTITPV